MTLTISLTDVQEARLRHEALGRGLTTDALVLQLLDRAIGKECGSKGESPDGNASTRSSDGPRILGLHAGQTWISDDFDAPIPALTAACS